MQTQQTQTEILVRIAQLRQDYEKLRARFGVRAISNATMKSYSNQIAELKAKL